MWASLLVSSALIAENYKEQTVGHDTWALKVLRAPYYVVARAAAGADIGGAVAEMMACLLL
jgi:hypothetical protein